jgi:hypothetical protein
MATRSNISIKGGKTVYCHNDGYPDGVGEQLVYSYRTKVAVEELIGMGNISSLGKSIEESVFYHRDRGEELDFWVEGGEYFYEFNPEDCEWYIEYYTESEKSILPNKLPVRYVLEAQECDCRLALILADKAPYLLKTPWSPGYLPKDKLVAHYSAPSEEVQAQDICVLDLSGNGNHLTPKEDE